MDAALTRAVDSIYEAALEPDLWPHTLQSIADCFQDMGAMLSWRRDNGCYGAIVSPSLKEVERDYIANWRRQDVKTARCLEHSYLSASEGLTDHDIMTPEEIETLPIYTQFLASHGLRWFAWRFLSPDPHIQAGLCVQRAMDKPPYQREDLQKLGVLTRHVEKSLRLSLRLNDSESCNLGMREVLSRLGMGVFAVDDLFRVVFSNPASRKALEVLAPNLAGDEPVLNLPARRRIAAALMRDDAPTSPTPAPIVFERPDGSQFTLYVLPVTAGSSANHDMLTRARAIVLIIDSGAGSAPDPALVRDIFGLTLGEAKIAALVGSGMAPRQAAERLGIAESTARTVLKRVFSKAGVSRQSELVAMFSKRALR